MEIDITQSGKSIKKFADVKAKKFKSEVELCVAVATWAERRGFEVYKEVHTTGGDIDALTSALTTAAAAALR